ncbi:MAG: hypothetical protein H6555_06915 [Lewinellaceae bacterium]|nr:hypothetical protein [Lewinellaceae bacterium]
MRPVLLLRTTLALSLVLFLASCAAPDKLLETGNYDQAIEVALRKLAGKKNKKAEYVKALEVAFAKVTSRDMDLAERLKNSGDPANWDRVYDIYRTIRKRQEAIEPLLPLADKEGLKANFRFVRTDELEREAKERAAAYCYDQGFEALEQARRYDDRVAARNAYAQFEKTGRYFRDYRNVDELMAEARDLGTTFVLVDVQNRTRTLLPAGMEEELLRLSFGDLNQRWREYHAYPEKNRNYDYRVSMALYDIEVSPSAVREREYEERTEIEDGFDYVLDERGNVKKDTAGNDIKIPRTKVVLARVLEVHQQKSALIRGRLEFFDMDRNQIVDSRELNATSLFENYAATFKGDERALSKESRQRIGNRPLPFPDDGALILEAARQLRPLIREELRNARQVI